MRRSFSSNLHSIPSRRITVESTRHALQEPQVLLLLQREHREIGALAGRSYICPGIYIPGADHAAERRSYFKVFYHLGHFIVSGLHGIPLRHIGFLAGVRLVDIVLPDRTRRFAGLYKAIVIGLTGDIQRFLAFYP